MEVSAVTRLSCWSLSSLTSVSCVCVCVCACVCAHMRVRACMHVCVWMWMFVCLLHDNQSHCDIIG